VLGPARAEVLPLHDRAPGLVTHDQRCHGSALLVYERDSVRDRLHSGGQSLRSDCAYALTRPPNPGPAKDAPPPAELPTINLEDALQICRLRRADVQIDAIVDRLTRGLAPQEKAVESPD
jgi:hypothetical protein